VKPDIVAYHFPCADGFTAAWAVHQQFGGDGITYLPQTYGKPAPDFTGKNVVVVDFSYPLHVLARLAATAKSILILDHHKTARDDMAGLPLAATTWDKHIKLATGHGYGGATDRSAMMFRNVGVLFDMERSGAGLAWDYFCGKPNSFVPPIVRYAQDRDLWRFKLPHSRQISSWMFSHPYDFDTWTKLDQTLSSLGGLNQAVLEGEAIERKHMKDVSEILAETRRPMVLDGQLVEAANMPYTMASDGAGKLAETSLFGATYFDDSNGVRTFSLRARPGVYDVGQAAQRIAARLGTTGGGHAPSAGFKAPAGWEGEVFTQVDD
jgi:hypothetical protein